MISKNTVLKVTYRIRAHQLAAFEQLFVDRILPLTQRHDVKLLGLWRTLVGNMGEYLELWEFRSVADFEQSWKRLLKDPELAKIFERTGPMVKDETFALLEAVDLRPGAGPDPNLLKV